MSLTVIDLGHVLQSGRTTMMVGMLEALSTHGNVFHISSTRQVAEDLKQRRFPLAARRIYFIDIKDAMRHLDFLGTARAVGIDDTHTMEREQLDELVRKLRISLSVMTGPTQLILAR